MLCFYMKAPSSYVDNVDIVELLFSILLFLAS